MKHDKMIEDLETRLRTHNPDSKIILKEEYDLDDCHGEIDLGIVTGIIAQVYEMKTTYNFKNREKAYQQLDKDERYIFQEFPDVQRVDKFWVYSRDGTGYCIEKVYDD